LKTADPQGSGGSKPSPSASDIAEGPPGLPDGPSCCLSWTERYRTVTEIVRDRVVPMIA
jgi:hypothetical protein